jgi:hypothetical protein
MFAALHPLLLWGTALVAVPVLIHLLLRQRPRPRPWAAMRWLLAAAQAAQRRWRLTNLLLLLLRCLAVVLLALAVARPALSGLGAGGHLVIVVDATASMGPRAGDPGSLAEAAAGLARREGGWTQVSVVAVEDTVSVLAQRATPAEARTALAARAAAPVPGGLDDALDRPGRDRLEGLVSGADVLLVSDFQQDDGARLSAALAPQARTVARWAVGRPAPNPAVAGVAIGDLMPGQPGELWIDAPGATTATLAVDNGAALSASASAAGGRLRIVLPPLTEGRHVAVVTLTDAGLQYDDVLEVALVVRPPIPALGVGDKPDYATAALHADERSFIYEQTGPAGLAAAALPDGGVVVLRGRVADGMRLRDWVIGGGVLWIGADLLRQDPALAALAPGLESGAETAGGPWVSGDREIDEVLGLGTRDKLTAWTLPAGATPVLSAGATPAAVSVPAGRGSLVLELADLAGDAGLQARGTTPLWVVRTVRRLTAAQGGPLTAIAGDVLPATIAGQHLRRGSVDLAPAAGAPLLAAPGLWRADGRDVVVLPSPTESRIGREVPGGIERSLDKALPQRSGADLGMWLMIAALIVILAEGALAAWAGRMYGR